MGMDFLETLVGRPNTIKTYKSLFYNHVNPFVNARMTYTDKDILTFVKYCRGRQLSISTTKAATSLLHQYIKWQTGEELPLKRILKTVGKQTQEKIVETPPKETLYKILASSLGTDLHLPMAIALFSGMRKGEVMGLKWGDIDFKKSTITIQRSYGGPTKNGKTRHIPLHPELKKKLLAIYPGNSDNYLESLIILKQFDPNKRLQALCKHTNIKPFTFHTLRHAFATYGLESGLAFNKIQKILGHSNLSTTVNFYWTSAFKPEEIDLTFI